MRASIIVFPGTNREGDVARAIEQASGRKPAMVWHGDSVVPASDLIVVPGGFSYGDYLRCGAMAAHSPVMRDVVAKARAGTPVLGICNGFQVLTEAGLLPGVLMRNASLKFVCRDVLLRIERNDTLFTSRYKAGALMRCIVAHAEGNYFADAETLKRLEGDGRVAFRYVNRRAEPVREASPNGAIHNIAGIYSADFRVLGMMPHPENAIDPLQGGTDGRAMFESVAAGLAVAA